MIFTERYSDVRREPEEMQDQPDMWTELMRNRGRPLMVEGKTSKMREQITYFIVLLDDGSMKWEVTTRFVTKCELLSIGCRYQLKQI